MSKFLRFSTFGIVGMFCACAMLGCSHGTNGTVTPDPSEQAPPVSDEDDPYTPPEAEYTIDESLIGGLSDANGAEFSAAAYPQKEDSPLAGKVIYWLGSSVTYGSASEGESMADFLAAKTGSICRKEAVSGTTLFDDGGYGDTGARSYTRRLLNGSTFNVMEKVDAFICQISTNDAMNDRLERRGSITADDVTLQDEFDRSTTLGAIEFIISYVYEMWGCPVYFYSGAHFGDEGARSSGNPSGTEYGKLVGEVRTVVEKWQKLGYKVDMIDLFNDESFNAKPSDDYYLWCTSDAIHPKRAGYRNWWMPYFEQYLLTHLAKNKMQTV